MNRRYLKTVMLLSLIALPWFVSPASVLGWGAEGHGVVAELADMRLTPQARQEVATLLEGQSMASVAVWADDIKHHGRPDTSNWHFVDIEIANLTYDPARDCKSTPQGDCVIAELARATATLTDKTNSKVARGEALKFMIHLVGDVHQPLHCADNHDRGGNLIPVQFFKVHTDLHAVWDTWLITRTGLSDIEYARHLDQSLKSQKIKVPAGSDSIAWALESHQLAIDHAYKQNGTMIHSGEVLGGTYYDVNIPIVDQQLAKAGVRLAQTLNQALK